MKKQYSMLIALFIILAFSCKKEKNEPLQSLKTSNPLITDLDKKVNEIMAPFAQKSTTAGFSIGIYKDNHVYYYGYGETKKGNNTIPDSATIYELGSITKTFTSLLMADYLQANSLSINCPVNNLLPADIPVLQHNNKPILVKHLLNHTSGLPRAPADFQIGNDPINPYIRYDSTMFYNYLKTYSLQRNPGQTFEYSNLGMGIAGVILERKTHKSYEQLLLEKICIPMGLNQTKINVGGNDAIYYAAGHDQRGIQFSHWDNLNAFNGAGAIKSNVMDLITYGKNILYAENSVLKNQIDSCLKVTYASENEKFGLGWGFTNHNGNELVGHEGATAGFFSHLLISKNKGTILVLLSNNGMGSVYLSTCLSQLMTELLK